ncbi:hypothetical protein B0J14DRAFT_467389, partial [Halenospora varia]
LGYVEHLGAHDQKELWGFVAPIKDNKPKLQVLYKAFDWLIQDAQHHCVRQVVRLEALFEANKKEVDKETQMPFNSWMDITTVKAYIEVCKQLLRYIFRSKDIQPKKRPAYKLTEQQQMCINDIVLLNQPLQDNKYKSVVISGLAVLAIREDNGWLDAKDYTPKYLAMIKLARLIVV